MLAILQRAAQQQYRIHDAPGQFLSPLRALHQQIFKFNRLGPEMAECTIDARQRQLQPCAQILRVLQVANTHP